MAINQYHRNKYRTVLSDLGAEQCPSNGWRINCHYHHKFTVSFALKIIVPESYGQPEALVSSRRQALPLYLSQSVVGEYRNTKTAREQSWTKRDHFKTKDTLGVVFGGLLCLFGWQPKSGCSLQVLLLLLSITDPSRRQQTTDHHRPSCLVVKLLCKYADKSLHKALPPLTSTLVRIRIGI